MSAENLNANRIFYMSTFTKNQKQSLFKLNPIICSGYFRQKQQYWLNISFLIIQDFLVSELVVGSGEKIK